MTLEPLLSASPIIQIHAYAAIAAFALGGWVLFVRKGDARHKAAGRIWVALMLIVAISSFFIWTIRLVGLFSPIHILSLVTLAGLYQAIKHARACNITAHRKMMQNLYLTALLIAGIFTFLPGRIMHEVVFGPDGATPVEILVFFAILIIGSAVGYRLLGKRLNWRLPILSRRA